jgi:signal transduction histidine kinase
LAEAHPYSGQGMGLAIARCIINCHHGHLWCTATVNQGAVFYWTLPETPPASRPQPQTRVKI